DRLGKVLKREGIGCSAAALGMALATEAVASAPVGMAALITSTALVTSATSTATTLTLFQLMGLSKIQLTVAALAIAGAGTTIVWQHHSELKLRGQNEVLQRQLAQLHADNESLTARVKQARRMQRPNLPAP